MVPENDPHLQMQNQKFLEMIRDEEVPARDRADALIFTICEKGIDLRQAILEMIAAADAGRKLKEKLKELESHPLATERFVGTLHKPRVYAVVTRGTSLVYLPAELDQLEGLSPGDPVLVDVKADRIVGCDGQIPANGDVVAVESLPPDRPGQIVVKHHEQPQLAWLHHELLDRRDECRPGTQVLYDAQRRFVLDVVQTGSDGSELLTDLDKLGSITRLDVGAPNQVVDQILERVHQAVEHPDWSQAMHARERCSYLFVGGTGVGKSFTLKLIAQELHDLVEKMTGERTSRVVMTDAAQFWNSLFGSTEQRIAAWAEKLQALGARPLQGLDGRILPFPLVIVLEECEALLRIRGDQSGSGHLFDRPLALLLQKTESLENALNTHLIWIATTNRVDLSDPAALRRMGMRRVVFGNLGLDQAASVLTTKVPDDMPIHGANGDAGRARDALFRKVLGYLYGPEPEQGLVEVRMANTDRRILSRCDLVTPATLEEAVSSAVDDCLRKSRRAGRLLGLDADDVIGFLDRHYRGLAKTLTRHNLSAYCPESFQDDAHEIAGVRPLTRRRPVRPIG